MRFQNERYLGLLTGRYLRRCICVLLVFLAFGLHTTYAASSLDERGGWHRVAVKPYMWENPVTGDKVSLLTDKDASVQYKFYVNVPGLHWTVRRLEHTGFGGVDTGSGFNFFIVRTPDFNDAQARASKDYILKSEGGEKIVCGRLMLQGTAVDKDGKSYGFSKLQSVFGKDRKRYSVLFISDSAEIKAPWDEDALCPIVKSFHVKEDNMLNISVENNKVWINPLSDKRISLNPSVKIEVEDIISHRLGFYQRYLLTAGALRAELIKVRDKPYGVDVFDMSDIQKLHLTDGTVIQWKQKDGKIVELPVMPFDITAYKNYEGQFSQPIAEGKKRRGIVFGGLATDEFVLVKVWRSDAKAIDSDDRNWTESIFNNSLEIGPIWE